MLTPTRIYISVPRDGWLQPEQLDIKRGIIEKIRSVGFQPHEFLISGDFSQMTWSYENLQYILGRCQGTVILGFVRWNVRDAQKTYQFNTAYNHYEGALALAKDLPTFILMHEHVYKAGIAIKGKAPHFVRLPIRADSSWLQTDDFLSKFDGWVEAVKKRCHIFFGYSSKAQATAYKIRDFLTSKGVIVMDGRADLNLAASRMDEIERASKSCMGSVFLFARGGETTTEDNLIFEAGYFLHAKGKDKTFIIREEGARLPASIGGHPYAPLQNREDISSLEKDLETFILNHL